MVEKIVTSRGKNAGTWRRTTFFCKTYGKDNRKITLWYVGGSSPLLEVKHFCVTALKRKEGPKKMSKRHSK